MLPLSRTLESCSGKESRIGRKRQINLIAECLPIPWHGSQHCFRCLENCDFVHLQMARAFSVVLNAVAQMLDADMDLIDVVLSKSSCSITESYLIARVWKCCLFQRMVYFLNMLLQLLFFVYEVFERKF